MFPIESLIKSLRRLAPRDRLATLRAALTYADPETRDRLALEAAELAITPANPRSHRKRRTADEHLRLLLPHWQDLAEHVRAVALAVGRDRWVPLLDAATPSPAASLATLLIDTGDARLAPALADALDHAPDAPSASSAAHALLAAACRLADVTDHDQLALPPHHPALRPALDPEPPPTDQAQREPLAHAIAQGLASFDSHRRKELLLAAVLLLDSPRAARERTDPLLALLNPPSPAHSPPASPHAAPAAASLRAAFRRARAPIARARALCWLADDRLAAACIDRLARAPTLQDHALVLEKTHLALAPARARRLRLIELTARPASPSEAPPGAHPGAPRLPADSPIPDRRTLASLAPEARRQAPRLLSLLRAEPAVAALALEPFLIDPDPLARLAAARIMPPPFAADLAFDPAPEIARAAALRLCSLAIPESTRLRAADTTRLHAASRLARSHVHAVRAVARDETDRLTPGCGSAASRLAARRAWLVDRPGLLDRLRRQARGDDPDAAVDALRTIARLDAANDAEPVLLAIIRDSLVATSIHPRVVASAVAALARATTSRAAGLLAECLRRHPDARVRANAADALRAAHVAPPPLADALGDPHHRVRASAARALIAASLESKPTRVYEPAALAAATTLLHDPGDAPRAAGLWLARRLRAAGAAGLLGPAWHEIEARVRCLARDTRHAPTHPAAVHTEQLLALSPAGAHP